jgi:hypothetical protein
VRLLPGCHLWPHKSITCNYSEQARCRLRPDLLCWSQPGRATHTAVTLMHCSSRQPLLGACNASTIKTVVARHVQQPSRASSVQPAAVGDFFKDIFDFNSWAPKSTRIWRLQQYQPPEAEETSSDAGGDQQQAPSHME